MAEIGGLFREIEEELSRDRMEKFLRRYGKYIVTLVLAIVLGTAIYVFWKEQALKRNAEATLELSTTLGSDMSNPQEAAEKLARFAASAPASQASIARFSEAALLVKQGELDKAAGVYDKLAKDAPELLKPLAVLLSAWTKLGRHDVAWSNDLEKLAKDDNPWRFSALEIKGMIMVGEAKYKEAAVIFEKLANDSETPQMLRERAVYLASVYGSK